MDTEMWSLPDLPMPPGRFEARRQALTRELTRDVQAAASEAASAAVRTPRIRSRWAWPALGAAVTAGVITVAFLPGRGQASPAASWTPIPTPLSATAAASAERQCQAKLLTQHWPMSITGIAAVLAEQRGVLTAVLFSGTGRYGMCVGDPADPIFLGIGEMGAFSAPQDLLLDGDPGQLNGSTAFRLAYGQVAPSVRTVEIETADGRQVQATVADGRFFAWWPSGADPVTITAYGANGLAIKTLHPTPTEVAPTSSREPGS